MHIYFYREELNKFKNFTFKDGGRFFNFLYGVNTFMSGKILKIEPVYYTVINFEKQGGMFFIETPWFTIGLFSVYPFIAWESAKGQVIEYR